MAYSPMSRGQAPSPVFTGPSPFGFPGGYASQPTSQAGTPIHAGSSMQQSRPVGVPGSPMQQGRPVLGGSAPAPAGGLRTPTASMGPAQVASGPGRAPTPVTSIGSQSALAVQRPVAQNVPGEQMQPLQRRNSRAETFPSEQLQRRQDRASTVPAQVMNQMVPTSQGASVSSQGGPASQSVSGATVPPGQIAPAGGPKQNASPQVSASAPSVSSQSAVPSRGPSGPATSSSGVPVSQQQVIQPSRSPIRLSGSAGNLLQVPQEAQQPQPRRQPQGPPPNANSLESVPGYAAVSPHDTSLAFSFDASLESSQRLSMSPAADSRASPDSRFRNSMSPVAEGESTQWLRRNIASPSADSTSSPSPQRPPLPQQFPQIPGPSDMDSIPYSLEPPPIATVGIDTSGDGQANITISGVDRDRNGVPDVLEAASRSSSKGSQNLSSAAMAYLQDARISAGGEPLDVKASAPSASSSSSAVPGRARQDAVFNSVVETALPPRDPSSSSSIKAMQPTEEWEQRLRGIFDQCDVRGRGSITRRELVRVTRGQREVAMFFGLPARLPEDGQQELLEKFFSDIRGTTDKEISWQELKDFYVDGVLSVPSEVREKARAVAKSILGAEVRSRLQSLEAELANDAADELRKEVARIKESRQGTSAALSSMNVNWSLPTDDLVAHLHTELRSAKTKARRLWSAVEAQDDLLWQLQDKLRQPVRSPEDNEGLKELAEAHRESSSLESEVNAAQEDAQTSQTHSRQLDALNGRLQRDLQALKAIVEERSKDPFIMQEQKVADECKQLKMTADRLEADAQHSAETTEALVRRNSELHHIEEQLKTEKREAVAITKEHDALYQKLWTRLAGLASLGGIAPEADSSMSDLVTKIANDWAEARRRFEWSQRHGVLVHNQRHDLEAQLDVARENASRSALRREAAAKDFEDKDRERRTRERRAREDLASAQMENSLMQDNRLEWKRTRPQLEQLIEELRVGSQEANHSTKHLGERLIALRKAVEGRSLGFGLDPSAAPSSPLSPQRLAVSDRPMSPGGSERIVSPRGSDADSPAAKSRGDSLRGLADMGGDSPGGLSAIRSESSTAPLLPASARKSEDPLIRKAAEESDLLHKRILALEDEKASLICSQEELIQFVKSKVEPVQRVLNG